MGQWPGAGNVDCDTKEFFRSLRLRRRTEGPVDDGWAERRPRGLRGVASRGGDAGPPLKPFMTRCRELFVGPSGVETWLGCSSEAVEVRKDARSTLRTRVEEGLNRWGTGPGERRTVLVGDGAGDVRTLWGVGLGVRSASYFPTSPPASRLRVPPRLPRPSTAVPAPLPLVGARGPRSSLRASRLRPSALSGIRASGWFPSKCPVAARLNPLSSEPGN